MHKKTVKVTSEPESNHYLNLEMMSNKLWYQFDKTGIRI